MRIGKIKLEPGAVLAPMAGVTDGAFRLLCREAGCALTVSEMISAKGLLYKNKKTEKMLAIAQGERPCALQLFGRSPGDLARATKIAEAAGADIVDFNMGCPVHKVVANGEGSALMKEPQLAYEILAAMVSAVSIPVTVKIRSGWDEENRNATEIARLAEAAGVAAITVHGRTREQFYSGRADWDIIAQVKAAVKVPVIGNGDVDSWEAGLRLLKESKCDGVMVGRAAEGNPWLFAQIKAALTGEAVPLPPTIDERLLMATRHLDLLIEMKGEQTAVSQMRRHMAAYLRGQPRAAAYRARFQNMESREDFLALRAEYLAAVRNFFEQERELFTKSIIDAKASSSEQT